MAAQGSRELKRELTNEALETLMERAVAAVQEMDQAKYQDRVCGQPEYPAGKGTEDSAWKVSDCTHMHSPGPPSSGG